MNLDPAIAGPPLLGGVRSDWGALTESLSDQAAEIDSLAYEVVGHGDSTAAGKILVVSTTTGRVGEAIHADHGAVEFSQDSPDGVEHRVEAGTNFVPINREGDVAGHDQYQIIAVPLHTDPCSPEFCPDSSLLPIHVVANSGPAESPGDRTDNGSASGIAVSRIVANNGSGDRPDSRPSAPTYGRARVLRFPGIGVGNDTACRGEEETGKDRDRDEGAVSVVVHGLVRTSKCTLHTTQQSEMMIEGDGNQNVGQLVNHF